MGQNISRKEEILSLLTNTVQCLYEATKETDIKDKCELGRTIGELSKIIIREENTKENPGRYPLANLPL